MRDQKMTFQAIEDVKDLKLRIAYFKVWQI